MQQILFFLIRNKNFLLFFVLFLISFALTLQSHSFHKNKFINSSNFISGGIYSIKSNISGYFNLKKENQLLIDENIRFRKYVESLQGLESNSKIDSTTLPLKYQFVSASVINNSYYKSNNLLYYLASLHYPTTHARSIEKHQP